MEQHNIYNLLIIDESGSMSSIYKQALSGINETLASIRRSQEEHPEQHHFVSVVTFEGNGPEGVKLRRDRVPVAKIKDLTERDYVPGSCTPLYDAMGISVSNLDKVVEEGSHVLVTIITDGYENASQEYSGSDIKTLVSRQREKGWTFVYIGANQDAVEVAKDLNIRNSLNFDATKEGTAKMYIKYCKANDKYLSKIMGDLYDGKEVENFFEE